MKNQISIFFLKHRKYFYLFVSIITLCCFTQCDRDDVPTIVGTWQWIYTYEDYLLGPNNPKTPSNTGIEETVIFYSDQTWKQIQNNVTTDSGSFTVGHGSYLPYQGAYNYVYDSIVFYKNNVPVGWDAYKILHNDTLVFSPGLAGRFISYFLPNNGSKWYVKQ